MRDSPDAAAEIEDLRARRDRRVDALGFARRRKAEVEVDRAPVGRGRHDSSAASCDAFMCAIASIVIIGLTPEALGNDEPSMT